MVRELGRRLGFKVWPHGLRHAAITEALDLTGGNVRAVQRFSGHRDVRILERYDDNRRDLGGLGARRAGSYPMLMELNITNPSRMVGAAGASTCIRAAMRVTVTISCPPFLMSTRHGHLPG